MGVYIKGMEMPKSCDDCPLNYDSIDCMVADNALRENGGGDFLFDHERHPNCPLIPVPPHGDLIDRDAYKKLLRGLGSRDYRREKGTICDAIKFLHPHYAPTVIPASDKDINVLGKEEPTHSNASNTLKALREEGEI